MAFIPSYKSRYYVGPQRFSVYAKGFDSGRTANMLDISSLEDVAMVFTPGQSDGQVTSEMMLDTAYATTSQFTTINTWLGTPTAVTLGPSGATRSLEAHMVMGNLSQVTMSSQPDQVVMANITIQPDGGVDYGVFLDAETAITVDTNGASTNNGAATANGGVAHLHSTAFSGLTSNSVIIEHSTNDSTWGTLATFTLVTGVGSERLVVAPGTTVNQYLRVRDDVTGSGSHTRIVAFARR